MYITHTSIFCIIISEFSYKKELGLIILFIINKNLKMNLYYAVLSLSLAIHLRIESNKEPLLNPKEVV